MKNIMSLVAVAAFLTTAINQANAYTIPEGWTSNPYFTHQQWSFNTSTTTVNADAGFTNPNGTPFATIDGSKATWIATTAGFVNGSGVPYTGIWYTPGPSTDYSVVAAMTIPVAQNTPNKQARVNAILQTNDPSFVPDFRMVVKANGKTHYADVVYSLDAINSDYGVYEVTLNYKDISGSTTQLILEAQSSLPSGYFASFDRIMVDTIPEPGTIAILAAGGLTLLGWNAWRRRCK